MLKLQQAKAQKNAEESETTENVTSQMQEQHGSKSLRLGRIVIH
jgi:hypothetical protein